MTTEEHRNIAGDAGLGLTIGAELRLRREERNQSVRDVADVVRIQARYIEALEENRIEHLPGRVYALGFVRTYAEYLGLDANDMVARFKQEAKGLEPQSDLMMPEPIDEGKAPTAAIIIVAILLAGAAYSAWYFMSGSDSRIAEIVPEVPERLAGLAAENAPAEDATVSAPTGDAVEPPTSAPAQESKATEAPAEPAAPAVTAVAPPAAPAPRTPATQTAPAPVIETPPPVPAVAPAPEPSPPASPTESTAAAVTPPPAPPPVVARDPITYGAGNSDARVVITALEDAWVEVTDADGAILFSRVLRKGDSYRAPDRPGATFVTGNAGGLSIEVDGDPAPSLGRAGVVRKNVSLDADLLKVGLALP